MSRRPKKGRRKPPTNREQKIGRNENSHEETHPFAKLKDIKKSLSAKDPDEKGPELQSSVRAPKASENPKVETETNPLEPEADDITAFQEAVEGARPLKNTNPRVLKKHKTGPRDAQQQNLSDDAKMLRELGLWIEGKIEFQTAEEAERMLGAVSGVDRRIIRKLKKGAFAIQDHLDLHGLTARQAQNEIHQFILSSIRKRLRCVLVIHGKGLHSKSDEPVLKNHVKQWLTKGTLGRCVLAFTSAQPKDGGYGATYVLLRKTAAQGDGKKAILIQE